MPQDSQGREPIVGRTYRGETSPPITTPAEVAQARAENNKYAKEPGAVPVHVYFVARDITNPILQASLLAYTSVRTATLEAFDALFTEHHEVPAPKPVGEPKKP